jgi:hypothetical protein
MFLFSTHPPAQAKRRVVGQIEGSCPSKAKAHNHFTAFMARVNSRFDTKQYDQGVI